MTASSMLAQISTCWPTIQNPVQFVMRYAPAIRKYVAALVRNPHDAEEVAQDFLVRVLDKGFCPENVSRGRFRFYLRAAVRNVALSHLRRRRQAQLSDEQLAALADREPAAEQEWTSEWRSCLLERSWQALELQQQQKPGSIFYTVLRQYTDDLDADSETHAARLSQRLGRRVRADAFRQQLSRARKQFATLLVAEVRQTLQNPTDEDVDEELGALELLSYIRG
jgi:RNA polymerase sigma factor (sigma-70 family)